MPDFNTLANTKSDLIRKTLGGLVAIGDVTAPEVTAITGPTGELLDFSAKGLESLGLLTKEGISHPRATSQSDITSLGFQEPTRTDISTDVTTVSVNCQQTSALTIGLATGFDTKSVVPNAQSGEVSLRQPARPNPKTYRLLTMSFDQNSFGEIYIARFFPKAKVSAYADQAYAEGDEALLWGATFTSTFDSVVGYSQRHFFGGPGWKGLLGQLGFATA